MITDHYDSPLTENLEITSTDDIGPGGAHHAYEIRLKDTGDVVASIQFQCGPRGDATSKPGATTGAVIALLLDHLRAFQAGGFPSRETSLVITKLEEAMHWVQHRTRDRQRRGVLGTMQK